MSNKRAIYFDGRERDLMRRALAFVTSSCDAQLNRTSPDPIERAALSWLQREVAELHAKFEEPLP